MTVKTIILERKKSGRTHKTVLRRPVRLHIDIIDLVFERAFRWGIDIDIDDLLEQVVDKR